MKKIIFMDGYDTVVDSDTQTKTIFSTKLPAELAEILGRKTMPVVVIDNVVTMFNTDNDLSVLDAYLLDEALISQDEREIIIENLYLYLYDDVKYEVKITGEGTTDEIIKGLELVLASFKAKEHVERMECEWEHPTLMTTVSEVE